MEGWQLQVFTLGEELLSGYFWGGREEIRGRLERQKRRVQRKRRGIPVVFLGDSLERRLLEEEVIPLSKSSKGGLSS